MTAVTRNVEDFEAKAIGSPSMAKARRTARRCYVVKVCMYVCTVCHPPRTVYSRSQSPAERPDSKSPGRHSNKWFYSAKEQDTAAVLLLRMRMRCGLVCGKSVKTQDECADGLRAAVELMSDSRSGSFIALSTPSLCVLCSFLSLSGLWRSFIGWTRPLGRPLLLSFRCSFFLHSCTSTRLDFRRRCAKKRSSGL